MFEPSTLAEAGAIIERMEPRHSERRIAHEVGQVFASGVALNAEEQQVMDDLLSAYRRILDWGLRANEGELTIAVHTIQGFIVQHMLTRLNPSAWGAWYEKQIDRGDDPNSPENRRARGLEPIRRAPRRASRRAVISSQDFERVWAKDASGEMPPPGFWTAVPCGHPPDPIAWMSAQHGATCHCGRLLGGLPELGVDAEDAERIRAIVLCPGCGCNVGIPHS